MRPPSHILRRQPNAASSSHHHPLYTLRPLLPLHNQPSIVFAQQASFPSSFFCFSTRSDKQSPQQQQKPQQYKQQSATPNPNHDEVAPADGNPELPAFSLEALGMRKNMKMLVIALLSVFGTIETWFWCKAAWIWWYGGDDGRQGEGQAE